MAVTLNEPILAVPTLVARRDRCAGIRTGFAVDGVTGPVGVPAIRARCRRGLRNVLVEIVSAEHVIDVCKTADSLEFLAELVLEQFRKAVAAEVAIRDEDRAVGAAGIVPLMCLDAAPRGDRAELEVWKNLVLDRAREAV